MIEPCDKDYVARELSLEKIILYVVILLII